MNAISQPIYLWERALNPQWRTVGTRASLEEYREGKISFPWEQEISSL
jgi:hypothetical protein